MSQKFLMIKTVAVYRDLPLVEGKTYRTKFQTGDWFKVIKIKTVAFKSGSFETVRIVGIEGYYVGKEHIGLCPIAEERLIHEQEQTGTKTICPHCEKEI